MSARLIRSRDGASAAEFALTLPVLLVFLFGIIDAGRFMYEYNQAEKATQMGVRFAAVTNVIASGLASANYVGQSVTVNGVTRTLTQGDNIPKEALGVVQCKRTNGTLGCTCLTQPCPNLGTADSTAFQKLVDRIRAFKSNVTQDNVIV
jgi:Flp pilus assembly protein TadG